MLPAYCCCCSSCNDQTAPSERTVCQASPRLLATTSTRTCSGRHDGGVLTGMGAGAGCDGPAPSPPSQFSVSASSSNINRTETDSAACTSDQPSCQLWSKAPTPKHHRAHPAAHLRHGHLGLGDQLARRRRRRGRSMDVRRGGTRRGDVLGLDPREWPHRLPSKHMNTIEGQPQPHHRAMERRVLTRTGGGGRGDGAAPSVLSAQSACINRHHPSTF